MGKSDAAFHTTDLFTGCPETARRETARWYYMICPPNSLLGDGASYDWPGPDYEEVIHESPDKRHRVFYGVADPDENPYW